MISLSGKFIVITFRLINAAYNDFLLDDDPSETMNR